MSRTLQLPSGEIVTPSQKPCEYLPSPPICIPFEDFGTYIVYWTDTEVYDAELLASDFCGIAVQNPERSKYYVSWNTSDDYGRDFSDDPEYSYEELRCMRQSFKEGFMRPQWIRSLSVHDHSGVSVFPAGTRTMDRWDSTSSVALWYPLASVRAHVVKDLIPLFRFLEINCPKSYRYEYELIRKDTKQRIVPYKFHNDLQTFHYISNHTHVLRNLIPELKDIDDASVEEADLSPEDWKIVEMCVTYLCQTDCQVWTAECGYVDVSMDFIDKNGHVHPCEMPSCIRPHDSVHADWNNQTLKSIILDYARSEICSQLQSHRKFQCPQCGEHRLYTKYRLPSYMVCNATVALPQLSDPKSDSPETYIGAGYPRIGPSVPDPVELESASCSNCGYNVTEEIRKLLGKKKWPEDSKIFQKYDVPEDWKGLLDTLCPPETW